MDTVRTLSNLRVAPILKLLSDIPQPFESSQLYSSSRDEKFVDESLRKSVFRAIVDEKLFGEMQVIVDKLNEDDPNYKYMLRRNDVTHIKYETGGFFNRHRDFLSTTSNMIEEFTLIVCVTPDELASDVEGGGTVIFCHDEAKIFDTTTPGCGLLFRKDFEHVGLEITKGNKHIVTANIWATRKNSGQVLLVTFPRQKKLQLPEIDAMNVKEMKEELHGYDTTGDGNLRDKGSHRRSKTGSRDEHSQGGCQFQQEPRPLDRCSHWNAQGACGVGQSPCFGSRPGSSNCYHLRMQGL